MPQRSSYEDGMDGIGWDAYISTMEFSKSIHNVDSDAGVVIRSSR